jgi:RNA polymerase sigma-70 factor (family 1)
MKRFSDQEILENINTGNEDAFEFVFLKFYNELCIYAFNILKDKNNSEEIVQEVFFSLWENRKELSIKLSVKAYLYRAVHNQCINFINHEKVRKKYADNEVYKGSELVSPVSSDYPIANLIVQELEERINQSISELPEQCRKVFLLIRYEGLSYGETAIRTGLSVNTIKTQFQRALSRLRESLKNYMPDLP